MARHGILWSDAMQSGWALRHDVADAADRTIALLRELEARSAKARSAA